MDVFLRELPLLPGASDQCIDLQLRASQGLGEDAAKTPYVKGKIVVLLGQYCLRCSVPPRHHSGRKASFLPLIVLITIMLFQRLTHLCFIFINRFIIAILSYHLIPELAFDGIQAVGILRLFSRPRSGEAEIADSDAAIAVYEEVARFQIPVQKVACMDVVQGA